MPLNNETNHYANNGYHLEDLTIGMGGKIESRESALSTQVVDANLELFLVSFIKFLNRKNHLHPSKKNIFIEQTF